MRRIARSVMHEPAEALLVSSRFVARKVEVLLSGSVRYVVYAHVSGRCMSGHQGPFAGQYAVLMEL